MLCLLWWAFLIATTQAAAMAPAPMFKVDRPVKDWYIVFFKEDLSNEDMQNHFRWLEKSSFLSPHVTRFDAPLHGYTGMFDEKAVNKILAQPAVDFVEEDSEVSSVSTDNDVVTQQNVTWGLSRVSHRNISDDTYTYNRHGGEGVTAYVIDGGMVWTHPEFQGRAFFAYGANSDNSSTPSLGHGSHVAGTIGAVTWGIAKKASIGSVQLVNSEGKATMGNIVRGINFAVKEHKRKMGAREKGYKGTTVNISFIGGNSTAVTAATKAAFNAGVLIAVAAGNDQTDACSLSPANSPHVITVGATNKTDHIMWLTNYGSCVDIFAPGQDIRSVNKDGGLELLTGTSMASPHVTGILAYYLSLYPEIGSEFATVVTPTELRRRVLELSTRDAVKNLPPNTPNKLVYGGGADYGAIWG